MHMHVFCNELLWLGREKTCSIFINATRNTYDYNKMDFIGQVVAYFAAIGCSVIQFFSTV